MAQRLFQRTVNDLYPGILRQVMELKIFKSAASTKRGHSASGTDALLDCARVACPHTCAKKYLLLKMLRLLGNERSQAPYGMHDYAELQAHAHF
ncbi:hypothetical protein TSA66_00700 [Noviherbaspirillum autotrophicum]|uniref:Uncharacterized protein n=1 Tax=Noviherbaspirillum autotrophicum TaxID=709839 RepID=A0A0C2C198_9BURK|nr:hypothetical protein TSA66_00700 [Noviherbaspirillum autotrophicum]